MCIRDSNYDWNKTFKEGISYWKLDNKQDLIDSVKATIEGKYAVKQKHFITKLGKDSKTKFNA